MYICRFCGMKFFIIKKYNIHLNLHKNIHYPGFACADENCKRVFSSYGKFKYHVYRNHSSKTQINLKKQFNCSVKECKFKTPNFNIFKKHVYTHFRNESAIECPLKNECKNINNLKSVNEMSNHFLRKHFVENESQNVLNTEFECEQHNANIILDTSSEHNINDLEILIDNIIEDNSTEQTCLRAYAALYLNLQSKQYVGDTVLQNLISWLNDIDDLNVKFIEKNLKELGTNIPDEGVKSFFKYAHNSSTTTSFVYKFRLYTTST